MKNYAALEKKLAAYGFRKFNEVELDQLCAELTKAVEIGLERRGRPTQSDGGVLALPTRSRFITLQEWENNKTEAYILVCDYAGTNWVTGIRHKDKNELKKYGKDVVRTFSIHNRKYTFNRFIELMVEEIGLLDGSKVSKCEIIALALGFPQLAELTTRGLDARLLPGSMTKHWEISDMQNLPVSTLVGEALLQKLKTRYPNLKRILIRNDAEAIGDDVRPDFLNQLPITIVAGTGLGMVVTRKNDNQNINLEIGHTPISIDTFGMIEHIYNARIIPTNQNMIEYHIGGDYIRAKVLFGLKNLASISSIAIIQSLLNSSRSDDLITKLALDEEDFFLPEEDMNTASIISRAALAQTGQLVACAFNSVLEAADYKQYLKETEFAVATDGSMLHKAAIVMQEFKKTLKYLIGPYKFKIFDASGLDGIAKFAVVNNRRDFSG